MGTRVARCGYCGTTIEWRLTWFLDQPGRQGKLMPVDLESQEIDAEAANLAVHTTASGQLMVRVLRKDEHPLDHEQRRMPHFATCPNLPVRKVPTQRRQRDS